MRAGSAAQPILTARDVAVGWGTTSLLEGLDFDVERGSVFCILGGSGTGKSTLLRVLIGLDRPQAGEVELHVPEDPYLPSGAPRSGVLFQSSALFGSMTIVDNVALAMRRWTGLDEQAIKTIARAKLRLVGLEGFENHLPNELSGGMRKRAGIARALALEAPLLFLDEPSAGLDPVTSAELDELLQMLVESLGVTILIVTHELDSIARIATDCVLLDREAKGVIAEGPPATLKRTSEDPRVRAFFDRISPHSSRQNGHASGAGES
ncbi:MAG: ABC transporter ATP-binding protein [Planctomycetota bacterium]